MVSISLYRGNLHRAPEVPRRWLFPTPQISLKRFRLLLNRRSFALCRLHSSIATTSNPSLNPNPDPNSDDGDKLTGNNSLPCVPESDPPAVASDLPPKDEPDEETDVADDGYVKQVDGFNVVPIMEPEGPQVVAEALNTDDKSVDEKPPEALSEVNVLSDTEKRKREIEEKLQVLRAKKHDLVQVLKQILNAEEELKRRNSSQGSGMRPSVPLPVDVTNDSSSMSRLNTPRFLGSEGNLGSDIERGEADDTSNHNSTHSRHLLRNSSTSPSSDSLHRRPAFSAVPHPRASLGGVGSPPRFGPAGHAPNLPTVSTSGASYIVSSPSPAASGGTSALRDSQQPSPWN